MGREVPRTRLTIVGVHTPEFGFERNLENIVERTRGFGVDYPVAIDSDYGVWQAFSNHFWPALYIADATGRIRYRHFGESEYAMNEMVIQQLLHRGRRGWHRTRSRGRQPTGLRGRRGLADAPIT